MKKGVILLALIPVLGWSQVKSGTSYSEHPAYDVIIGTYRVFESGTEAELRKLYAEDAKIQGPGDTEAGTVDTKISNLLWWQEKFSDIKIIVLKGATPDIIKYESDKKGVWTMDWMVFSAMNKISGLPVKLNFQMNNYVTNEGKITMSATYFDNESAGDQIQASLGMHRNGCVYDEHPIINTLNKMVPHFEAEEILELATYFADDVAFYGSGVNGKLNLQERTAVWHQEVCVIFSSQDIHMLFIIQKTKVNGVFNLGGG